MKTKPSETGYWGGVMLEYCRLPELLHAATSFRLAGCLLVGAALLALTLTGCGPSTGEPGKPSGTNAPASRVSGKTNQVSRPRPGARTNLNPATARAAGKANPAPGVTRPAGKANPVSAAARAAGKTNAAVARTGTGTNAVPAAGANTGILESIRNFHASSAFYRVVGIVVLCLCLAGVMISKKLKAKAATVGPTAQPEIAAKLAARPAMRKAGKISITTCNVLQVSGQGRQIWQFDARGRGFVLNREQTSFGEEPLPAKIVAKDWRSLFQHKLNVAWLPPERVFLRVAQFPASDFDETLSMVELQLEKLSPMPVTQIVWTIHVLPQAEGNLQTVIVMMVSRNEVEEFLGQLEGKGYLADRLELPMLDQVQATSITESGAWIYPEAPGGRNGAVV
ncbi:MAG: hypothetical protein NT154_00430, partial [Verrucomicrobia bacterium]|nr:hypothetical protein [Verrucomicrobiota bacterium]